MRSQAGLSWSGTRYAGSLLWGSGCLYTCCSCSPCQLYMLALSVHLLQLFCALACQDWHNQWLSAGCLLESGVWWLPCGAHGLPVIKLYNILLLLLALKLLAPYSLANQSNESKEILYPWHIQTCWILGSLYWDQLPWSKLFSILSFLLC